MTTLRLVVLLLLVATDVSLAQRGGRGRGTTAPNYDQLVNENRGTSGIAKRDMEFMNPVKLLIDKRKALALSDEQLTNFRALDAKLATMNDTLFRQLDSLRKELKPQALSPAVEQMRARGVRRGIVEVVQAIRANYAKVEDEAVPMLNESQLKAANELLEKQEKDGDETIREKLGGGGGRRGG